MEPVAYIQRIIKGNKIRNTTRDAYWKISSTEYTTSSCTLNSYSATNTLLGLFVNNRDTPLRH